ncbi:hypothetical protein D9M71_658860 [compost metagenome]
MLVHGVHHFLGSGVLVSQAPCGVGMGTGEVVLAGQPDADALDGDVDQGQHDVGGQAGLADGRHLVFDGGVLSFIVDGLGLFRQVKRRANAAVALSGGFRTHAVDHLGLDAVQSGGADYEGANGHAGDEDTADDQP